MNILFIGVDDSATLIPLLENTIKGPHVFYHIDDIDYALYFIEDHGITLFICDLKFSDQQVERLLVKMENGGQPFSHGVFIHNTANNHLAIKGLNSHVIADYILRPYDAERIAEMWKRCQ